MSLMEFNTERQSNPVDAVERLAAMHDWSFERAANDEISISVQGRWTDYHVSFTWMDDIEALHLACAFDLKVPEPRRTDVLALIALINEQLWIGHFDMWAKDGIVMFRHALLLAGGVEVAPVRGAARYRARHERTLLPGLPVRGLGRQVRARSARCRDVRDRGRGLSLPLVMPRAGGASSNRQMMVRVYWIARLRGR
jgi:hypothetical protein